MVATRRRAAEPEEEPVAARLPADSGSDSDDDAPEEVSLATGKQSADHRRKQEAEAKAAAARAAKERRAAAARPRAAAEAQEEEEEEPELGEAAVGGDQEEDEEEADEELDLLPDDVLAALASNKRSVPTAQQARLISEQLRRQGAGEPSATQPLQLGDEGAAQNRGLVEREAGPVVVRVLHAEQPSAPSQSARDFLQRRLQGGVKRSAQMLTSSRALQPGWMQQRQAQHLAAAQRPRPQPAVAAAGGPAAKRRR